MGDPLQSIYRFRQADVSLFDKAREWGVGNLRLESLQLLSNFRSAPELVSFANAVFHRQACPVRNYAGDVKFQAFRDEVEETESLVEDLIALQEKVSGESIVVLGRSRSQVSEIVSLLKRRKVKVFAMEMQHLSESPEILDLLSLIYAFTDETDELSLWALLRSPWIGLELKTLWEIAQRRDPNQSLMKNLQRQIEAKTLNHPRVSGLLALYEGAQFRKKELSFVLWVQELFEALGGASLFVQEKSISSIEQFFRLLETFPPFEVPDRAVLEHALNLRFANEPASVNAIQIMTIHKAKGLEFDHVFLPRLHRIPRRDDPSLLLFKEQFTQEGWQMLLAPIKSPLGESSGLYRFLMKEEQRLAEAENYRVLYVATTRAKKTLNFSFVQKNKLPSGSFLEMLAPWAEVKIDPDEQNSAEEISEVCLESKKLFRLPSSIPIAPVFSVPAFSEESELNHPQWPNLQRVDRALGSVVHAVLAASHEVDDSCLKSLLRSEGVFVHELPEVLSQVKMILSHMREDPLMRSLSPERGEVQNELMLIEQEGYALNRHILDRTFVDSSGVRWILDYKIAHPNGGESLDAFFLRMRETYQAQLERYARVFRKIHPGLRVKMGLVFPLQKRVEWI